MSDENILLLERLKQNPDLCGSFSIDSQGLIRWDLYETHSYRIDVRGGDGYIDLFNRRKPHGDVTHWHPDPDEMYEELCLIGTRGNIIVVRYLHIGPLCGASVRYIGPEDNCPRRVKRMGLFSRSLILKAQ